MARKRVRDTGMRLGAVEDAGVGCGASGGSKKGGSVGGAEVGGEMGGTSEVVKSSCERRGNRSRTRGRAVADGQWKGRCS